MLNKIKELEFVISHLDSLYEQGEDCIHPITNLAVTDGEYDALRRELCKLNPKSDIFNTPTSSNVQVVEKIVHNPPMTSISKASHEDKVVQTQQLLKWIKDSTPDNYKASYLYQSYKLDGVACALYYENGMLKSAGLRPRDGINGEDVTKQIKYVSGVPERLNEPVTCSIRGEIICKLSDFEIVQKELEDAGEKLRANPRNHAAGGIRQFKEPEKVKNNKLSFIAYAIEGLNNPPYKTERERAVWCNKQLGVPFVRVENYKFEDLEKLEKNVSNLDYEVDGVIVGVNDLEEQEQLGRSGDPKTGNPKGKIAWKFSEERAFPEIESIEWNTGRTGAIKPVANFKSVSLAGTQVSRATLHNIGFIFRNQIGINTQIIVLKAGKIIPKVVGVKSNTKNYNKIEDLNVPCICPSCNTKTKIVNNKEMYELFCTNENCSAKNVSSYFHFLKTLGVLGVGESKIESLTESGLIDNFSSFYKLTLKDIEKTSLSKRQGLLVLASIHMIKNPEKYTDDELLKKINKEVPNKKIFPLWKIFAAFGIEAAGKSAGKALQENFSSLEEISKASIQTLSSIKDIGVKTAEIIFNYFDKNKDMIEELLDFIEIEVVKVGPLTGQVFVFTGGFLEGKSHWENEVEKLGGKCSSSVSKKVNYVIVGSDAGSKEQKADELGITKLNIDQLKKMLN